MHYGRTMGIESSATMGSSETITERNHDRLAVVTAITFAGTTVLLFRPLNS